MINKLILILVSMWWAWTALIDFVVIPTTFRTISDFFNAGELGIALFSKLNLLEILLGLSMTGLSIMALKKAPSKRSKIQVVLAALAWLICLNYFFYLTPKISELTQLWKNADSTGSVGISGFSDIQQSHQLYHRIYVGLDSLKLIILSAILFMCLLKKEREGAKA